MKCKSLHVGSQNPCHTYRMDDTKLDQALMEKDLGIHIDSDLKFHKQAAAAAGAFHDRLTKVVTLTFYFSLIIGLGGCNGWGGQRC